MKIRLYKPVSSFLLRILPVNREHWEDQLSRWAGFKVFLPNYFWEVHLYVINQKLPNKLTVECQPEKGWFSVFYSYNLNGDLKKYMEIMLVRKCKSARRNLELQQKKAS